MGYGNYLSDPQKYAYQHPLYGQGECYCSPVVRMCADRPQLPQVRETLVQIWTASLNRVANRLTLLIVGYLMMLSQLPDLYRRLQSATLTTDFEFLHTNVGAGMA
jgi:hypothetical protein